MRATDIVAAAILNFILYMVVLIVLFVCGGGRDSPAAADAALDQIEKTSRTLGEKQTAEILGRPSEDGALPAVLPSPSFGDMKLAAETTLIADLLVPVVRRELRVERRDTRVLSIAALVMAFSPVAVVAALARLRSASATPARESEEQTGPDK